MTETTAQQDRCWELIDRDGNPWEYGEGIPHFATHADAADATTHPDISGGPWTPEQIDFDCVLIVCHECSYVLDEDGEGIEHVPASDAEAHARDYDWTVVRGAFFCPECTEEAKAFDVDTTPAGAR